MPFRGADNPPPLYGLVLAGGRSRMGRDKAFLEYHDLSHLSQAAGLLDQFCNQVLVSCRSDQVGEPWLIDLGRDLLIDSGDNRQRLGTQPDTGSTECFPLTF